MIAIVTSSAEGGVRKHVLDLLAHSKVLSEKCGLIIYPTNQKDQVFDNRDSGRYLWLGIDIAKSLHLSDLFNFIFVLIQLYKNKVAVVHGHGAKGGLYCRLAKIFKWNLKVIYSPHGGAFHDANHGRGKILILTVERLLDSLTDLLIFESHFARSLFLKSIPASKTKFCVIQNPVEVKSIPSRIEAIRSSIERKRSEGYVVLTLVGRVRHIKGHDILAAAARELPCRVFIYFVGSSEEEFKATLVDQLYGIEHCFWGDEEDVSGFYMHSDVVVVPSRAESFGYVPVEASQFGAKIVASEIPPIVQNLQNYSSVLFFTPCCHKSLAACIEKALEAPLSSTVNIAPPPTSTREIIDKFDEIYSKCLG